MSDSRSDVPIKTKLQQLSKLYTNYPNILRKFEIDGFLGRSTELITDVITKELSFTFEGKLKSPAENALPRH